MRNLPAWSLLISNFAAMRNRRRRRGYRPGNESRAELLSYVLPPMSVSERGAVGVGDKVGGESTVDSSAGKPGPIN